MLIAALTRNFQREKNAQVVEMLLYFKIFQRRLFQRRDLRKYIIYHSIISMI